MCKLVSTCDASREIAPDLNVVGGIDCIVRSRLIKLNCNSAETQLRSIFDTVVVRVIPHEIADGEIRDEAKVNGEIGVKVGVTIIYRLGSG